MAESISRRKYAGLVKFLTATMNDPKASIKMRYMAAARLDDLYARNEARADRAAERKARALAGAPTPVEVKPPSRGVTELADDDDEAPESVTFNMASLLADDDAA